MSDISETPYQAKRRDNISTIFLLPSLQINEQLKLQFYSMGFVNTYMFFDKVDYQERFIPLYLVFRREVFDMDFYKFMIMLEKNPNHIETLDYPGGNVVFVFRIPKKFEEDYRTFVEGKYSKFSKEFKSNFPMKVYKVDSKGKLLRDGDNYVLEDSMFYHIFNRTEHLKNIYRTTLADEGQNIELPEELYDKYKPKEENLQI